MTDSLSPEKRSWNMSRIRSKNTKPEKIVRSLLHGMGYRFRLHCKDLPGTPDIVLPKHKTVVFVNGCFWHRHPGCKYAYNPKSRIDFWKDKFKRNVKRDQKKTSDLNQAGWKVAVIWECETKSTEELMRRLRELMSAHEGATS